MTEHPLIAFLRARLDEDERSARESMEQTAALLAGIDADSNGKWHITTRSAVTTRDQWGREADVVTPYGGSHARHIARHDPAYVLADTAAKQRILARFEYRLSMQPDDAQGPDDWDELTRHYFEVIRDLAEPFASHPDYPKGLTCDRAPADRISRSPAG